MLSLISHNIHHTSDAHPGVKQACAKFRPMSLRKDIDALCWKYMRIVHISLYYIFAVLSRKIQRLPKSWTSVGEEKDVSLRYASQVLSRCSTGRHAVDTG